MNVLALFLTVVFLAMAGADGAIAQRGPRGGPEQSREVRESMGQIAVGLVPVYPAAHHCTPVVSPFGSLTRYDGSARANDHGGFHNGIDITLREGTPILAIAAGEVILAGAGGLLVGNYVWLRHTPADTGLPSYLYSRYQHLDQPSPLPVGRRLNVGDPVGASGKTGTVGPYYGARRLSASSPDAHCQRWPALRSPWRYHSGAGPTLSRSPRGLHEDARLAGQSRLARPAAGRETGAHPLSDK